MATPSRPVSPASTPSAAGGSGTTSAAISATRSRTYRSGQRGQHRLTSGGFGAQVAQRALTQQLRDAHISALGLDLQDLEVIGAEADEYARRELAGFSPTAHCSLLWRR